MTTSLQSPGCCASRPALDPTADRSNAPTVLAAAAVTMLLWASAFVAVRGAGPHFDPGAMALLRMLVGSAVLTLIAVRAGVRRPPRRTWPLIAAWGVAWFGLYNLALNAAETRLDAGTTAMLVNLAPLLVVLAGGVLLREGFPRALVIGAPVSFAGVLLIGVASSSGRTGPGGVLLALAAAVLYAGAALLQKHLLRVVGATTLTWLGALAGTIMLLPWAPRLLADLGSADRGATLAVVYLGVFPTAIAFTTWAYVLGRTSAGRTAATSYLVPAIVVLLSWVVLAEVPTPVMLLGGALCLLGVFITRLPSRRTRPPVSTLR